MLISRLSVVDEPSSGPSVKKIISPALDFVHEIKVAYDLGLGFIPSSLMLLGPLLFRFGYQVLEIPHGCLVAADGLGLVGNA